MGSTQLISMSDAARMQLMLRINLRWFTKSATNSGFIESSEKKRFLHLDTEHITGPKCLILVTPACMHWCNNIYAGVTIPSYMRSSWFWFAQHRWQNLVTFLLMFNSICLWRHAPSLFHHHQQAKHEATAYFWEPPQIHWNWDYDGLIDFKGRFHSLSTGSTSWNPRQVHTVLVRSMNLNSDSIIDHLLYVNVPNAAVLLQS